MVRKSKEILRTEAKSFIKANELIQQIIENHQTDIDGNIVIPKSLYLRLEMYHVSSLSTDLPTQ